MTNQQFNEQLSKILANIETLPESRRGALLEMAEEARARYQQIGKTTARAREALEDWRLVQKYRIFDAEASLREAQAKHDNTDRP
ncbi:MAG: hypothetical protein KAV82_05010 [Phycisphaerae bacterium]|nr:hypothetical protein [Phycisphaerae bacterium]